MKLIFRIIPLAIFFLAGCAVLFSPRPDMEEAHTAFAEQDYTKALELYSSFIEAHSDDLSQIPDSVYRDAGLAAFHLEKNALALEYLTLVRYSEYANAETQYALATLNRQIDNLSRELTALEKYVENFPDAPHREAMQQRLFEVYVESRNYEQAIELWPSIKEDAGSNETLLNDYFTALDAQEKEEKQYDTARELLHLNPENIDALTFLATHYFWKAENRYQKEMEAYERNRTHAQYARLLKAFDVLNADFRTSLNYFLRLYELDPQPRHARFIGNIYLRFDDKRNADIYHRKADE